MMGNFFCFHSLFIKFSSSPIQLWGISKAYKVSNSNKEQSTFCLSLFKKSS